MNRPFQWEEAAKEAWGKRAVSWDNRSVSMWDHGSRKDIIPFMQKHLGKGAKVIDVGCGSGYGTYKLHRAGYEVEGIDISPDMVRLAEKRCGKFPISFSEANVNALPFPTAYCDSMMVINVLEWTKSPYRALLEIKRVLKSGGLLCVGILGPTAGPRSHSYRRLYGEDVLINSMMPWEFTSLVSEMDFQIIDDFGVRKKETNELDDAHLPKKLQQSLSFMWVFMLKKN